METQAVMSAIELVCLALGASSAFIFDSFFILSLKDHTLKSHETKMLNRISLLGVTSSIIALGFYIALLITRLEITTDLVIGFSSAKLIILSIALISAMTLRSIHLPTLIRHQKEYLHLSERMADHQNSLISTAVYSTFSWVTVIFLTAIESSGLSVYFHATFINILVVYLISAWVLSHIFIFLKNKVLTR